jgi:hypothetical protein
VDDEGPKPRASAARSVVLWLVGAGIFGAVLGGYIWRSIPVIEPIRLIETSDAARGPDPLEIGQRVAEAFVAALRLGDYDGAYAQMARPYRAGATAAAFAAAWRTPLLAAPRTVKLSRAHSAAMQTPDGGFVAGATFTATGMMMAAAGALEVSFTFLREADDAHVLAVFVGGVPIVQGLGPPTR